MPRIRVLGGLLVEGRDGPLTGFTGQRRPLALLALLADSWELGVSREKLTALLWPESTEERARHGLSQLLYRLRQELGPDAIEGTAVLRLSPAHFTVDVREFEEALACAERERAAALYAGPFLDGFYLPGAPDFERWAEEERARLAHRHRDALERLAMDATAREEHHHAATWWSALATDDPLNTRVATRLVEALAAAGDRAAALRHVRVHETLVRVELGIEPDAAFRAAAQALREQAAPEPPPQAVAPPPNLGEPAPASPPPGPAPAADGGATRHESDDASTGDASSLQAEPPPSTRHPWPRIRAAARHRALWSAVALIALAAVASLFTMRHLRARPVLAVGYIADYTDGHSAGVVRTLPEMLTTNLSRLGGIDIVGRTRLYDVIAQLGEREIDARTLARAARHTGADQLLDGALYRKPDGTLRLDVRVLDLRRGIVRYSHEVEGADAFALADSTTARLASSFRVDAPTGLRLADVTTSSMLAYELYEEGLRAFYRGDEPLAGRYFESALDADSGFTMAAYYAFRSLHDARYLARAERLAEGATERERLIIQATRADAWDDPLRVALAESLTVRYPTEPHGYVLLGKGLMSHGDLLAAQLSFRRAIALDSLSLTSRAPRCAACDALHYLIEAELMADSLDRAERLARDWVVRQAATFSSWNALATVLSRKGDAPGAEAAHDRARAARGEQPWVTLGDIEFGAELAIRTGNFVRAERLLAPGLAMSGTPAEQSALWWMAILRRHQGRIREASAYAEALRRAMPRDQSFALLHAQVLRELGLPREAALVCDSVQMWGRSADTIPTFRARHTTWVLTHKADALAAAGDSAGVSALIEPVRSFGRTSGYGRDNLLHHHVRGLLLGARGRQSEAAEELRRAIWSPTLGYTRTNVELARVLLALGRPREAVPVLRAALAGTLQSSQLYVTHTEVRALLGRAYADLGLADSAALERRWVARALEHADAGVRARIEGAEPRT